MKESVPWNYFSGTRCPVSLCREATILELLVPDRPLLTNCIVSHPADSTPHSHCHDNLTINKSHYTKSSKPLLSFPCTLQTGEERGVYRVLVGKPEGKRPLGRPRHRWVDNIRMDLQEVGCGYMDWIGLAQDRDRWRTLVSAVMNLRAPWNAGNFLTSCKPVSFSRKTLHHGVSMYSANNLGFKWPLISLYILGCWLWWTSDILSFTMCWTTVNCWYQRVRLQCYCVHVSWHWSVLN